jgi:hypothetical protein
MSVIRTGKVAIWLFIAAIVVTVLFFGPRLTVRADDAVQIALTITDVVVDESAGVAELTVTLDAPAEEEITLPIFAHDGMAVSPEDFLAATGASAQTTSTTDSTVTFQAGQQVAKFDIAIVDDDVYELDESFRVAVGEASGDGPHIIDLAAAADITLNGNLGARAISDGGPMTFKHVRPMRWS